MPRRSVVTRRLRGVAGASAALLLVAGLGVAAGAVADVRAALTTVATQLHTARDAAHDQDLAGVDAAVARAVVAADTATARTRSSAWRAAMRLPALGDDARAVAVVAELAAAVTDVGAAAGTDLAGIAAAPDRLLVDGGVDVAALDALRQALQALPVDAVEADLERLRALPTRGLVDAVADARTAALAATDTFVDEVGRATAGVEALADLVGAEGPRRYLLAVQNPGELRGTGGLIAYVAELSVDGGVLRHEPAVGDDLAAEAVTTHTGVAIPYVERTPVARPAEFAARYDAERGGATVQSVNLDPHLPMVAPVLARLYAARTGRPPVDGVVLLDPVALELLVPATGGPLPLPTDEPGLEGLPSTLTGDNTARTLLVDVYDVVGGANAAVRRRLDEAVTATVLGRLRRGDVDAAPLVDALRTAVRERHVQVWSADPDVQSVLEDAGAAGALPAGEDRGDGEDFLALSAVNAGPDKSDVHVAHALRSVVQLTRPTARGRSQRQVEATISVTNPLVPEGYDDYVVGTEEPPPGRLRGGPDDRRVANAKNRTWFTWWTPGDTARRSVRTTDTGQAVAHGEIHGHRALDLWLETPSRQTRSATVTWAGPVTLRPTEDGWRYVLRLWRQAKGIPDDWDVTVTAPPGHEIVDATAAGGGRGVGLGPDGDTVRPLRVEATATTVRVTGRTTADAVLTVDLRPRSAAESS